MPSDPAAPPASKRAETTALIALLVGAGAIGFSPIFVRLSELGPVATAFWRVGLALPALWLVVALQARMTGGVTRPSDRDLGLLAIAGIAFIADLTCWHFSIGYTSVANATLLANFTSIFVTLGAWLLFRDRVNRLFVAGMVLALIGAMLLMAQSLSVSYDNLFGDALGLITALFYASYLLAISRVQGRVSAALVIAISSTVTALGLLPVVWLFGETLLATSARGWAMLAGLALISHAAGQGLIAYAFARLPASFSSVALLLQPAVAAFLGWALLGEALGGWQIAGSLVILAGIVVARRASLK